MAKLLNRTPCMFTDRMSPQGRQSTRKSRDLKSMHNLSGQDDNSDEEALCGRIISIEDTYDDRKWDAITNAPHEPSSTTASSTGGPPDLVVEGQPDFVVEGVEEHLSQCSRSSSLSSYAEATVLDPATVRDELIDGAEYAHAVKRHVEGHDAVGDSLNVAYAALGLDVLVPDVHAPLFLTDAFDIWSKEYYVRFSLRLHRLIEARLQETERFLFKRFLYHDCDFNGSLSPTEVADMVATMSKRKIRNRVVVDFLRAVDADGDGTVSFIELLRPWGAHALKELVERAGASLSNASELGADWELELETRIRALEPKAVRAGAAAYKHMLRHVSEWHIVKKLEVATAYELDNGLGPGTMEFYYKLLKGEFEGQMELLFDLFKQVDSSGNMLLEEGEIYDLIRLLDPNATDQDMKRYFEEINPDDEVLNYVSLVDWWDQSRVVPNSLVAEKGVSFLLQMHARSATGAFFSYFSGGECDLVKNWKQVAKTEPSKLRLIRDSYKQAFVELCRYKLNRRLEEVEEDSLKN